MFLELFFNGVRLMSKFSSCFGHFYLSLLKIVIFSFFYLPLPLL